MKKNFLILTFSILLLVFAVLFYMYASNIPAEVIEETNETETGVVVEEEISETEDLENVEYTDFSVYTSEKKEVRNILKLSLKLIRLKYMQKKKQ